MKQIFLILFFVAFGCAYNTPYSLVKFRPILKISKLQAPLSAYNPLYSRHYGDFKYYSTKYFYLLDDSYMTFYMCQKKHRSELRFKNDWNVNTKIAKAMEVKVKLFPLNESREFTFLQIHSDPSADKPSINKPLLRIVWEKNIKHTKNHIWAIIRTTPNPYKQQYKKIDLGEMPKDFFDVKIEVKDSKLNIWMENKHKVRDFDISYWNKYKNYFKLGVYLQDIGCAKALFQQIKIKDR